MARTSGVLRTLASAAEQPLLARFYDEVYLPAFAHQREPREVWDAQLIAPTPTLHREIVLAGEGLDDVATARLDGGAIGEWYPRSRCALLTYLVVAPGARAQGLGRALLTAVRQALAAHARRRGAEVAAVLGELSDPAGSPEAAARLARFRRWGARTIAHRYIQPSLGPGLARDRDLRLIAFFDGAPPACLPGAPLRAFVRELYAATENVDPEDDPELGPILGALGATVALE